MPSAQPGQGETAEAQRNRWRRARGVGPLPVPSGVTCRARVQSRKRYPRVDGCLGTSLVIRPIDRPERPRKVGRSLPGAHPEQLEAGAEAAMNWRAGSRQPRADQSSLDRRDRRRSFCRTQARVHRATPAAAGARDSHRDFGLPDWSENRSSLDHFKISLPSAWIEAKNFRFAPAVSGGQRMHIIQSAIGPDVDFSPKKRHDVERRLPLMPAYRT